MDPQSHCALGLAVPEAQIERSMADLLRVGIEGPLGFSDIIWQISRDFDLAPATVAVAGLEQELATAPDRDHRLAQQLSAVQDQYEFCVIDCPPSIGLLTFNALRASNEVLIPVETGYFSLQGSVRQHQTIQMMARRAGHHVRVGVLATMYDVRTKMAREILSELKRHFPETLLPVLVNFNSKLKEAASFGQPITEYDKASRGMQDFERLAAWLAANPPEPPSIEQGPQADVGRNPVVSRAAELVERARALSAKTAVLSASLSTNEDFGAEGLSTPDPTPSSSDLTTTQQSKSTKVYGVRHTGQGVLFIQPAAGVDHCGIAGDFNEWDPKRTPMTKDNQRGVWQACIKVPPGRYRYRLVVDGQWVQDPYNSCMESNPFGDMNSIIEIAHADTSHG